MGINRVGHTEKTRKETTQRLRQIDYVFANVPLINFRKILEPHNPNGSNHACLSAEIPSCKPQQVSIIPSKIYKKTMTSLIMTGMSFV